MTHISQKSKFIFGALAFTCGVAIFGMKINDSRAQTSGLSGKYGCLENSNAVAVQAPYTGSEVFMNSMVYVDFDARTYASTSSVTNRFNQAGASQSVSNISGTFTVATGPITGSYTMRLTGGGGATATLMPVNSGNTLLYATANLGTGTLPSTGVCQKI
ncbi:hypothetical protein ICN10_07365 [Polynucleobacter sp. 86C-FISCH]|uniref:hypothetical protein n=1 Tax=Polynucleobacter sp. 86C-FISCH TaxID=2689101 RepID=UPI001C0CEBCB|nr:hypothetical protein [Polynucleobacter sp. 86C-FISCH]MBU3596221.1 hypothetical protein [Polynucleobacter sp. 86C-FISCH]